MVRRFFQLLYGSVAAKFESPYSTNEALKRLSAAVTPSVPGSSSEQCAVDAFVEGKVRVCRVIPLFDNPWKPVFYGSFSDLGTGSVLVGVFRLSMPVRVAMSIWFGFVFLWMLLVTAIVATTSPGNLVFLLFGIAMFFIGTGVVRLAMWWARNDMAWLSQAITHALEKKATSEALDRSEGA